jgi:hypothetical protein
MNDMEIGKTTVAKKTTMTAAPILSETKKYSENERKNRPATNKLVCLDSFSKTIPNMLVSSKAMEFPSSNGIAVM